MCMVKAGLPAEPASRVDPLDRPDFDQSGGGGKLLELRVSLSSIWTFVDGATHRVSDDAFSVITRLGADTPVAGSRWTTRRSASRRMTLALFLVKSKSRSERVQREVEAGQLGAARLEFTDSDVRFEAEFDRRRLRHAYVPGRRGPGPKKRSGSLRRRSVSADVRWLVANGVRPRPRALPAVAGLAVEREVDAAQLRVHPLALAPKNRLL